VAKNIGFSLLETLRRSTAYSSLVGGFGSFGRKCEFDVSVSGRICFSFTSTGVVGSRGSKSELGVHRPGSGACESKTAVGSPALPGTRAVVLV
jgi:hypothetical protein